MVAAKNRVATVGAKSSGTGRTVILTKQEVASAGMQLNNVTSKLSKLDGASLVKQISEIKGATAKARSQKPGQQPTQESPKNARLSKAALSKDEKLDIMNRNANRLKGKQNKDIQKKVKQKNQGRMFTLEQRQMMQPARGKKNNQKPVQQPAPQKTAKNARLSKVALSKDEKLNVMNRNKNQFKGKQNKDIQKKVKQKNQGRMFTAEQRKMIQKARS